MAQKSDSIILEEEIDPNYVPTEEEVLEYAKWLGMDLVADQELFWIAKEGLKAPLPEHWKPCKTTDTGEIYYFNFSTGESTWDHPCDEHYRKLYEEEKRRVVTEQKASADVFKAQAKREVEILLGKDKKKKGRKKRTDAAPLSATAPAPVQVTPIREPDRKVLPTLSSSRELGSPPSLRPASAPTTLGYTKVSALAAAAATANARASAEQSQEHGTHAQSARQAEIDRLQQRIEELTREQEQKVDELQNQITELQDENDHLRDSVHEWKQKYETSKASKCHKCEQLQLRLDANIERTENATKLADDLRREAADLRQQLLAAEEDNQSLGAKLANAEQEMARLGAAPKRAEERVRELEAARQEQAGLIDRLQKSVTTLESTVRQQAQAEMRTAQDATAKQAQLEMQCEVLRKSRDAALRDAELLKEQLQQTTANIRAWEQLRQSHADTLSTLKQNQAELQGVRLEYEQFKISAQEKLDIANDELASLRQELLDRQAEQEALEKEWDTVQLQLRDARTTIQAELSEESQRYGEVLKQLQAANEYSAQLEARVATLTAELEAAVAEKNTSQAGVTANEQTKEAGSQAGSERHAGELAELARKHAEELQQETERSESQIQQLRADKLKELQELEKSIDLQFQAQHARQSEVDELATQLAQRSADLSLQLQQLDADFVDLASVRSALVSAEEAKRRTHDEVVQLNEVVARQATELQSLKAAQSSHIIPAVDVQTESRAMQSEPIACPQCIELKEQYQRVLSEKEATFAELHILQGQLQQANEQIQQLQHQHSSTAATRQQVIDELEAKYQQQKSQSEGLAAKLAMVSQELAGVKRVLEAHQETSAVSPSATDHVSHQQQPQPATDARFTLQTLELLRDLVTEVVRSQLSTAAFGQRDDQEQINPNVQRATDNENKSDEGQKCRSKPRRQNKIPSEQAVEVDEDDDDDIADGISGSDSEHSGDSAHAHDSLTEQSFDRMENELRQVLDQEQRKLVRMRLQYSNDKQILQAERERLAELKSTLKRRSARKQSSRKSSHDREYRQLSKKLQSLNHKIAENRRLKQLICEKEGRVARLRKALSLVERLYDTHSTLDDEESKLDFSVTPSKTSPPREVPTVQPHPLMRAWAGPLTGLQSDNTNNIRHQRQIHHWAKQQVETQYRAEQHATASRRPLTRPSPATIDASLAPQGMSASIDRAPEAPAIVRRLVSRSRWLHSALQHDDRAQDVFVQAAKSSQRSLQEQGIAAVSCSCRLAQYPALSEEERARQSQKAEAASALQEIFGFYKKLQAPGSQLARKGLSYEDISGCNSTMSFFETLWFCRNFGIVPTLISKNDLLQIWRELVVLRLFEERDRDPLCVYGLTMRMFVGFLGVLAVAIAHDPVSRRVLYGNVAKLSLEDKCLKLAAYLHLDDVRYARNQLQTLGRETAAMLNFRSRGEKSKEVPTTSARRPLAASASRRRPDTSEGREKAESIDGSEDGEITATHIRKHAYLRPSLFDECWQYLEPFVHGRNVHAVTTHGPFLDLGTVVRGWEYNFRVEVTNLTRNELAIASITQEGLHSDSVAFTYLPEGFASGITRVIDVNIAVNDEAGEDVIAYLSICLSQAGGARASYLPADSSEVHVVVAYRVLPENLAHLSQPGKQPHATSMNYVPSSTRPRNSRRSDASKTESRTSSVRSAQRRPSSSDTSDDFLELTISTVFHRLSQQAGTQEPQDDKLKSI